MPAVLAGPSEVLDVGRTQRLVTPGIRAALELRDGGCIFPGCDKPPHACHAHHHPIVEPGHDPTADRWQFDFRADGTPQVIPPKRVDPTQRPRLHARFLTPRRT